VYVVYPFSVFKLSFNPSLFYIGSFGNRINRIINRIKRIAATIPIEYRALIPPPRVKNIETKIKIIPEIPVKPNPGIKNISIRRSMTPIINKPTYNQFPNPAIIWPPKKSAREIIPIVPGTPKPGVVASISKPKNPTTSKISLIVLWVIKRAILSVIENFISKISKLSNLYSFNISSIEFASKSRNFTFLPSLLIELKFLLF